MPSSVNVLQLVISKRFSLTKPKACVENKIAIYKKKKKLHQVNNKHFK